MAQFQIAMFGNILYKEDERETYINNEDFIPTKTVAKTTRLHCKEF